jgi:uncharacterized integral membrane protein
MTMMEESKSPDESHRVSSGSDGPNVTLIVLGIVIALCVIFFLVNSRKTNLDFVVFEKTTTVRWTILVAMLLGVAIDRVFSIWWRRRRRKDDA